MQHLTTPNLIIGFGKAGKTLTADLAKNGQNVILVESSEQMYGGTCINIGCIPSKKLLVEGEKTHAFEASMSAKNNLVGKLRAANFAQLNNLPNVRIITAQARFQNEHTVVLHGKDGEFSVTAERIFINTGSLPARLDIEGADGKQIHDSTGILSLAQCPRHLVIVGAGFIALEFAFMFRNFGSEVTILNADDTFLPREDRDVAEEMLRILNDKGIQVKFNAQVQRFVEQSDETTSVETSQGSLHADAVLVAIGRRPNTVGLNLDKAGIAVNTNGFIQTDDLLRTSKPHIWALGDVAGSPQFTYISLDDYRIVRDQLLGNGERNKKHRTFPTVVFTEPPLAHIGLTEQAAAQSGKNFTVLKMKADAIPKAKILNQPNGFLKAIVDKDTDAILGVTLFCAEAHELINLFKTAMDHHIPASYFRSQIFTHPTMTEALNNLFA